MRQTHISHVEKNRSQIVFISVTFGLVMAAASASAGIVQKAGKDAVGGAVQAVKERVNSGEVGKGTEEVTKGAIRGVTAESDKLKEAEKQMVKGLSAEKHQLAGITREVTRGAAQGMLNESVEQMRKELGDHGDGPFAITMAATTERISAALVRGASSQIHLSGMLLLCFAAGAFSSLLCGVGIALLLPTSDSFHAVRFKPLSSDRDMRGAYWRHGDIFCD